MNVVDLLICYGLAGVVIVNTEYYPRAFQTKGLKNVAETLLALMEAVIVHIGEQNSELATIAYNGHLIAAT